MLREADIFNPAGILPDVSKSVVIGGNQSASALAGINSGRDYAAAIQAAVAQPLDRAELKREILSELDLDPTAPKINKAALERRNLARELRNSVGGRGRSGGTYSPPDYGAPPLPAEVPSPPPPGMEDTPVAGSNDPGNLLGAPPPAESVEPAPLFPTIPEGAVNPIPLLPVPLPPVRPWSPADIFRNIFP